MWNYCRRSNTLTVKNAPLLSTVANKSYYNFITVLSGTFFVDVSSTENDQVCTKVTLVNRYVPTDFTENKLEKCMFDKNCVTNIHLPDNIKFD